MDWGRVARVLGPLLTIVALGAGSPASLGQLRVVNRCSGGSYTLVANDPVRA